MYLLLIAWVYVVLMMVVSEATSTQGTVLGAFITLLLYGVLPLSVVMYLMQTPARRARRRAAAQEASAAGAQPDTSANGAPDGSSHAPSDAVSAERKEP